MKHTMTLLGGVDTLTNNTAAKLLLWDDHNSMIHTLEAGKTFEPTETVTIHFEMREGFRTRTYVNLGYPGDAV